MKKEPFPNDNSREIAFAPTLRDGLNYFEGNSKIESSRLRGRNEEEGKKCRVKKERMDGERE